MNDENNYTYETQLGATDSTPDPFFGTRPNKYQYGGGSSYAGSIPTYPSTPIPAPAPTPMYPHVSITEKDIYGIPGEINYANPIPDNTRLRDGEILLVPLNQGYLIVRGNRDTFNDHEYYAFSTYKEVLAWLKNNEPLTKDDAKVVENI